MLQTSDDETEILLGNRQLLGIFVVVVVLLGIAFGGGYMLGRGKAEKKAPAAQASAADTASTSSGDQTSGQTRTVTPADSSGVGQTTDTQPGEPDNSTPLGSRKHKASENSARQTASEAPRSDQSAEFAPTSGQTYLQVAAVARSEAGGIADVLRKKGFRAHAVPVPGNAKTYRVLVGPIQDASDLSATRDRLRESGFAKVFVQRY